MQLKPTHTVTQTDKKKKVKVKIENKQKYQIENGKCFQVPLLLVVVVDADDDDGGGCLAALGTNTYSDTNLSSEENTRKCLIAQSVGSNFIFQSTTPYRGVISNINFKATSLTL